MKKKIVLFGLMLIGVVPATASAHIRFSSYTKGMHEVRDRGEAGGVHQLEILLPKVLKTKLVKEKLDKRLRKFGDELYLSLNGVASRGVRVQEQGDRVFVTAEIPSETYNRSTLAALRDGEKVCIGMQSANPKKYLLEDKIVGKATLLDSRVATGHQYTLEQTFVVALEHKRLIEPGRYLGINGSGLTVQSQSFENGKVLFKVQLGRNTQELTTLATAKPGQEFNLTAPAQ